MTGYRQQKPRFGLTKCPDLEPLTKPFNKAQADNGTRQRQQGEMDIQPSLETNS
jgi:hypothetical protein